MEWTHRPTDIYHVTGIDRDGKRFKIVTANPHYALAVNVWRGTLWLVRDGRRTKITTWEN